MPTPQPWWKGCSIYQIYPRSFYDSNNDGIGDLLGICEKLPYIADLGVDAIWISPFFTSPMKDFGYDVSDYRSVDPIFGHLDDFKQLLEKAHELGLKVIIDQVMSHTSDQHAWFEESRQDKTNPKNDWYVWADAKPDGTPPNNWLSVFGGSAWQWDTRRQQYYMHNYLTSMPDLNFNCDAVQVQILEEVEFWLKLGVDGLRLDTCNYYFCDAQLRDNPVFVEGDPRGGIPLSNPYTRQKHVYDKSRPENLAFLQKLRKLMDAYGDTTTVGEIGDDFSLKLMGEYTADQDKLHMAYSFSLLKPQFNADYLFETIEALETNIKDGWPCWAIGNHDVPRVASRWSSDNSTEDAPSFFLSILLSLRGSLCLYQGDELGMEETQLTFEQLQDPYGITMWPDFKGRDGCRTPIPWSTSQYAGFSSQPPWLPLAPSHHALNIESQLKATSSHLAKFKTLHAFRQAQPALCYGDITLIKEAVNDNLFALIRTWESKKIVALFNLNTHPINLKLNELLAPYLVKPYKLQDISPAIFNAQLKCSNDELATPEWALTLGPEQAIWLQVDTL